MTLTDLDAIRSRIQRAFGAVQDASGSGYEISYTASGMNSLTHFRAVGIKAPEQLEDEFLNLFIWTWNLKDYLKSCFESKGRHGKEVEIEANRCHALTYVADIANRAKHGLLNKSRSGEFAELVEVGFSASRHAINQLSFAGADITLDFTDPRKVEIHAAVITKAGVRLDALTVLRDAMYCWETKVIQKIST